MMAGGYLSFQGFQAMANYAGTPVEDVLPVTIHRYDDRIEAPEGVRGELTDVNHPITQGIDKTWPYLLGFQDLVAKEGASVLATAAHKPLLVAREYGRGRSVAFASDISPHWAPQEFMEWPGYSTLFGNIVTWVSGK